MTETTLWKLLDKCTKEEIVLVTYNALWDNTYYYYYVGDVLYNKEQLMEESSHLSTVAATCTTTGIQYEEFKGYMSKVEFELEFGDPL